MKRLNAILIIGVLLLIFLTSCGPIEHKVEAEGKIDRVFVEHKLNIEEIEKYFFYICAKELTDSYYEENPNLDPNYDFYEPTEEELEECTSYKLDGFFNIISNEKTEITN